MPLALLPRYDMAAAFGHWTFAPAVFVGVVLLGAVYLAGVAAARRRGRAWPWWRVAGFLVLGLGSIVVCTMSSLATYDHTVMWALSAQLTLLISIVPVCLAVGDPLGLIRAALSPPGVRRWDALMAGPVVRVLTFPVVAAVLGVVVMLTVFLSGLLEAALRSGTVLELVYLLVLVIGCLLALPLLGAEVLPGWCTEPFRLLFAAVDGLLDAIPGIVLMTYGTVLAGGYYANVARPSWTPDPLYDQHVAGALMLALSEVVALPLLLMLFFRWASAENRRDAAAAAADPVAAPPAGDARAGAEQQPAEAERPWWEDAEGGSVFGRRTEEFHPRRRRRG